MKIKEKKCKICGEKFTPSNSFVKVCSVACSIKLVAQELEKKERKKHNDWKKEVKERHKTHSDFENELQPVINEICRLIDKDLPCISCGKPPKKANAGHRFSVGSNNSLRFNLHNLNVQCNKCNDNLSGNPDGYDEGLIRVYGKEYYEYVKFQLKADYPLVKLTIPELLEARAKAMKIRNELKKKNEVYSAEERIRLREKINKQIGIYLFDFKTIEKW